MFSLSFNYKHTTNLKFKAYKTIHWIIDIVSIDSSMDESTKMTTNSLTIRELKDTATLSWSIKVVKFKNEVFSKLFVAPISKDQFSLGIRTDKKARLSEEQVCVSLWYLDKRTANCYLQYRVSILNEYGYKQYTREYTWNYTKFHYSKYDSSNFMSYNTFKKMLVNGSLKVNCEVDILQNKTSFVKTLLETGELCDVTFVVGNKEFRAHKLILAIQSEVFRKMFKTFETRRQNPVIVVQDIGVQVFDKLLRYLYNEEIPYLETQELLFAAEKYKLYHLKSICEQSLNSPPINVQLPTTSQTEQERESKSKCLIV